MPASKPYRFHPQAWQEVEAAESWYRQRNLEASTRFLSAVYDALETLARPPQRLANLRPWNLAIRSLSVSVFHHLQG
jgi:plasmid stabilization system protein ParE